MKKIQRKNIVFSAVQYNKAMMQKEVFETSHDAMVLWTNVQFNPNGLLAQILVAMDPAYKVEALFTGYY